MASDMSVLCDVMWVVCETYDAVSLRGSGVQWIVYNENVDV